jgi:hypothetical protein
MELEVFVSNCLRAPRSTYRFCKSQQYIQMYFSSTAIQLPWLIYLCSFLSVTFLSLSYLDTRPEESYHVSNSV